MTQQQPAQTTRWQAPASVTIYDVGRLDADAASLNQSTVDCEIDLSAVTELDGAGIQWLLALRARLHARGASLRLVDVPAALQPVFVQLGVAAVLLQGREAPTNA